jgi:cell division protein FtsB
MNVWSAVNGLRNYAQLEIAKRERQLVEWETKYERLKEKHRELKAEVKRLRRKR